MKTICAWLILIQTAFGSFAQTDAQGAKASPSSGNASAASSQVSVDTAIHMYADLKGRTVLQHPRLPVAKVSLASAQTKEEQAAALETMFKEQKIAVIPDGERFVMLVPYAFTNSVTPKAPARAETDWLIPAMSVKFTTVPLDMVLQVYADFAGKTIVNPQDTPRGPFVITFIQTTALSKPEICYALETQLAWNNIRLVPDGDKNLKLELFNK